LPIAVGKSFLTAEFQQRFNAKRISTRQLLLRAKPDGAREALIALGLELDARTNGRWVLDEFLAECAGKLDDHIWLIDAVRTKEQVDHFWRHFGGRIFHVHLTAPIGVLRERYLARNPELQEFSSYDEAKQHGTERNIGGPRFNRRSHPRNA